MLKQNQVLIVDNNDSFFTLFEESDFSIEYESSSISALAKAAQKPYALVIANISINDMPAITFLKTIKELSNNTKLVLLLNDLNDDLEIEAINSGIDYVWLMNRSSEIYQLYINNILNEYLETQVTLYSKNDGIKLNAKTYEVHKDEKLINLTPREFGLLSFFLNNKKVVFSRQEIIKYVWGDDQEELDERTIDVHIKRLREKLDINSIVSIRGIGYKWQERE